MDGYDQTVQIDRDFLIAPKVLPDGRTVWDEHYPDIGRRLREGDATLGWVGDPRLSLVANVVDQQFEVWRAHEDGTQSCVARRPGLHPPGPDLLRRLATLDSWHADPVGDLDRVQAAREKALDADWKDRMDDAGDRLHHGFVKDLGEPAADGRIVGGGKR